MTIAVCLCVGHTAVVSRLLEAGADPAMTINGQTAVDIAQAFEQTDLLDLLSDCSTGQQPKIWPWTAVLLMMVAVEMLNLNNCIIITSCYWDQFVCLSVCLCICLFMCLCVCLSTSISVEPPDRSSRNFLCRSSVAMARSFSGGAAIRYMLPCLQMTSHLVVMGRMAMRGRLNLQPTITSGVAIPGRSLMSMNALLICCTLLNVHLVQCILCCQTAINFNIANFQYFAVLAACISTFPPVLSHFCSFHEVLRHQSAYHAVHVHSIRRSSLSHLLKSGTLCLQLCTSEIVPTLSASISRLITSSKHFHPSRYLPPCTSDSAFVDIMCIYKFHLLTYMCLHCFWLSVPVQSIAWKDLSPKWPVMCRVGR